MKRYIINWLAGTATLAAVVGGGGYFVGKPMLETYVKGEVTKAETSVRSEFKTKLSETEKKAAAERKVAKQREDALRTQNQTLQRKVADLRKRLHNQENTLEERIAKGARKVRKEGEAEKQAKYRLILEKTRKQVAPVKVELTYTLNPHYKLSADKTLGTLETKIGNTPIGKLIRTHPHFTQYAAHLKPKVVLRSNGSILQQKGNGLIARNKYITNAHVAVIGAKSIEYLKNQGNIPKAISIKLPNGKEAKIPVKVQTRVFFDVPDKKYNTLPLELLAVDQDMDLAVLKLHPGLCKKYCNKGIEIIPTSKAYKGMKAVFWGNAAGRSYSFRQALISQLPKTTKRDKENYWHMYQIDRPIYQGTSGSPFFGAKNGGVIGLGKGYLYQSSGSAIIPFVRGPFVRRLEVKVKVPTFGVVIPIERVLKYLEPQDVINYDIKKLNTIKK